MTKKIEDDINTIKESQIRMEEDVKHHIKRTDQLEELHIDNRKRITKLEEPLKARAYLTSIMVDIGKYTGFVLALLAIARYFNKI